MSRLARTPISERIKLFNNGTSDRPRSSPLATPTKTAKPTPSPHNSPVLKPANRSQFSAKDPSNPKGDAVTTPASRPSPTKKSPTNSVASSKSDLSRTPSNASTKSADLSRTASNAKSAKTVNGRNSPSPIKKSPASSLTKKAATPTRSNPGRSAAPASSPAANKTTNGPAKQDENQAPTVKIVQPTPEKTASLSRKSSAQSEKSPNVSENIVGISRKSSAISEKSVNSTEIGEKSFTSISRKSSTQSVVAETNGDKSASQSRKSSIAFSERSYKDDISSSDKWINVTVTEDTVDRAVVTKNNNTNDMEQNILNKKVSVGNGFSVKKDENGENNYWTNKALGNANSETIIKSIKLDVETRDDRISSLQRDITELQMGGATEDEVRGLKKNKKELEMQLKEQEDELDDLAAQVQMLEGSKTKLEMEMATIKKEHRREIANKEEEIEEARASANKKVKILEQQLEQEHEERIMFLRERHDLEQKIGTLQDMLERSGDEEQVAKLKRDLKKTKALLRDAQTLVEKNQNDGTNKVILRQLKNQLEDAEFARTAAMKARQNAELELADTHVQLEDVSRSKQELEDRHLRLNREKAELSSQLNENEEELQEVMRRYKASVAAVSTDQITIQDQQTTIQELEEERNKLRDSVAELSSKLGNLEGENVSTSQHKRLELKIRELESKLELEQTSKSRLETQITRLKEAVDKLAKEKDEARIKDANSQEQQKKISRQLRDLKEEYVTAQGKETELGQKKFDLEKQLEVAEAETLTVRSDLKLALKRIEDLQAAIAGEIDSDNSDDNSDSSDEEMHSFLEHHRRAMSVQRERESMARESVLRESVGRDMVSMSREVRASVGRNFSAIEETTSLDISKSSIEAVPEGDESQA